MLARVFACALVGLEGVVVDVEVDTASNLPKMVIVGLPDAAVQESRERVQSAIKNSGLIFPRKKVTVNLAPAAVRKEVPAYDLPIAVGVLISTRQIPPDAFHDSLIIGELSLDGSVRHVSGILPVAALARQQGYKRVIVPEEDAREAALIPGLEVIPVPSLRALYGHATGGVQLQAQEAIKIEDKIVTISRASGPLLDRIDIHIQVPRVDYQKLSSDRLGEPSSLVQERVENARKHQRQRFIDDGLPFNEIIHSNADMGPAEIRTCCVLDPDGESLMRSAMSQLQLSARSYHRVLKLARTIADLEDSAEITPNHLAEALQYRPRLAILEV